MDIEIETDVDTDVDTDVYTDIENLDSSWITEFENLDKDYKNYYTEDLSFIKFHSIYINKNNEIEKLREEKITLKTPGILTKEELVGIIKHNSFSNETKYSLLSILKYNINIEPINLKSFLRYKDKHTNDIFLQSIKNIDTIIFDKSISMFHDINDLIILFHEKIYKIGVNKALTNNTKKVFINPNPKKKTKRKQFKENDI